MTGRSNSVISKIYDALNRHDPDAVALLATDDVAVEDVAWSRRVDGKRAIVEHYRRFFEAFPDARYTSLNTIVQGDVVVDEWTIHGNNTGELHVGKMNVKPTGKALLLRGINVFELRDGLVARQRIYYDTRSFASQLGLSEMLRERWTGQ